MSQCAQSNVTQSQGGRVAVLRRGLWAGLGSATLYCNTVPTDVLCLEDESA